MRKAKVATEERKDGKEEAGDDGWRVETAVEFGRLYRRNGDWKFEAIGNGSKGGLEALVNKFVY